MKYGKLTVAFVILAMLSAAVSAGNLGIRGSSPGAYHHSRNNGYQKPYGHSTGHGYVHPRVVTNRPYSSSTYMTYGGYPTYTPGFSTSTYTPSFAPGYGYFNTPPYGAGPYYQYQPSIDYTQGYYHGFNDGRRSAYHPAPRVRKWVR